MGVRPYNALVNETNQETESPKPGSDAWLALVDEPIEDPDRVIVDPHHHFWHHPRYPYLLEHLWADTQTGHHVEQTVFVECGSEYLTAGPEHLRVIGETQFVRELAQSSRAPGSGFPFVGAIVPHADLTLPTDKLEALLDAHANAGDGLVKGIRHEGARSPLSAEYGLFGQAPPGLYARSAFVDGVRTLGRRGWVFDAWHYQYQNPEFLAFVKQVPDTVVVLDHFGSPVGIGPLADQLPQALQELKSQLTAIAACPNVVLKLGGMAMTLNGFGWDRRARPATSDEFVAAQREIYLHAIDKFGPSRCMFESNYPMDRRSISYPVLWNAFKKLVADFSETEKDLLFNSVARRVYRLKAAS